MTSTDTTCYHCGEPIPRGMDLCARIEGADRPMCCVGCKAVAEFIQTAGFEAFYRFRETPDGESGLQAEISSWTRFDSPELLNRYVSMEGNSATTTLDIGGMYCSACVWLFDKALESVPGVETADVNPTTRRAVIRWDAERVGFSRILSAISQVGFKPTPIVAGYSESAGDADYRLALKRLIVAAAAGMQVMMFAVALYAGDFFGIDGDIEKFLRTVSLLVTLPIVFYSAQPFFASAWRGIRNGSLGMDLPVSIAISIAFAASAYATWVNQGSVYFDSVAMFVFFLSATRFLEMRARHRCEDYGLALSRLLPDTAARVVEGGLETVTVDQLQVGDVVIVKLGDVIPADGVVCSGYLSLDESFLTGESIPVAHIEGEPVFAGALVERGHARIRLTRIGASTNLAEIGRMLDRAKADRPPIAVLADRIASKFVLGILTIAAVTWAYWHLVDPSRAFEIVLATLVVTCPCALALATPAALASATACLAGQGVLLVRGRLLEVLDRVTTMVFDKTGTLTVGKPELLGTVLPCGCAGKEQHYRALAAAIEEGSEHVLARAFSPFFVPGEFAVEDTRIFPGRGVEAKVDGDWYRLGSIDFVGMGDDEFRAEAESDASFVFLAARNRVLARFDIGDMLRPDARAALDDLKQRGVRPMIASGDRLRPVASVAQSLGVQDWHAGLTPEQKLALVAELRDRGETVAMVGDGVNDAPVLASADVSIALDAGTALARASADAVSLGRMLRPLVSAVDVSKRTHKIIRQNLAWAIAYNLTAAPLAVAGFLQPWMAAIGMSLSSLIVVLNALRLRKPPGSKAGTVTAVGSKLREEEALT